MCHVLGVCRYVCAYNSGDWAAVEEVMAEDVHYHDMIYDQPFRGRKQVGGGG